MHRAGFVNIVGNPNVGKSTLMNLLVGERLSIITSKAQTTRHRIMGIVNGEDYQIVYSDTPGVLRPSYRLQESMLNFSEGALVDADVILYVTDTVERPEKNSDFLIKVAATKVPTVLIINKIDLSTPEKLEELFDLWQQILPQAQIVPISALEHFNTERIIERIVKLLPESPPFFEKDRLTDRSLRFFAGEIIREKILTNYDKEIPYSTEVVIEKYEEGDGLDRISATIHVARKSQKGIIIGHQGAMLKKIGTQARHDLEAFLGKKVFLEIFVKIAENWRDDEKQLRGFGYVE
ncbi:GTP-binding protein Era [Mucinivorans hirudinis]|uniref:GTPase Era n=1 Tax=Mucinivorans hirudinis TaxID=1433126 RepID=A0A060R870_9BACT|nr:GTP-binding protein Era [Mucinivorans hirudinis]